MSENNSNQPRVLPLVFNICEDIVKLFFACAGGDKRNLALPVYNKWVAGGNVEIGALNRFIWMLSKEIENTDDKVKFVQEARKCVKLKTPK